MANRPIYVVLGVTVTGQRDILGLWAGEGSEGAKYWLQVLTEIKNRGVADVCIVVCDGLKGLPEAINTCWPQALVQTCLLHYSDIWIMPIRQGVPTVFPGQKGGRGLPSRHNPDCVSEPPSSDPTLSGRKTARLVTRR